MHFNQDKEWFEKHIRDEEGECGACNPDALEPCVICGGYTGVPKNLNVEMRECYIDGVGQLCWTCYKSK